MIKICIDTNVLVRAVHMDPGAIEQCQVARKLIQNAIENNGFVYINNIVLCETLWVLSFSYKLSKNALIEILELIISTPCYQLHNRARVTKAFGSFKEGNADFADYLIAELSKSAGVSTTYTFDRRAAKQDGFTLLESSTLA